MSSTKPQNQDSKTSSLVLSIYGYLDYRSYLKDYYQFRKESERGYSYRAFSRAAGFKSPNFLKLVIQGSRNISLDAVEKFIKALRLKPQMAEYFRSLVKMNQAKTDQEKDQWLAELKRLTPQAKRHELATGPHQYLSHWIYPVLREMASLPEFRDDPYWIARRLNGGVTPQEISSALKFLVDEGYLAKDDSGHYEARDNMVVSSDEVANLAIRNFHRQMVDCAKGTLDNLPVAEREFGALTMKLPNDAMEELKFRLKTFRRDLHQWAMQVAEDASSDTVVQLNFQMFPHTRKVEGK